MTTSRVYREKLDLEKTYQELIDCSGTQFDPSVAKAFVTAHKRLMDLVSSRKKAA
jgi:HD-GYP domain-containing protein (c-di-GMP phosphodiesterase class II)